LYLQSRPTFVAIVHLILCRMKSSTKSHGMLRKVLCNVLQRDLNWIKEICGLLCVRSLGIYISVCVCVCVCVDGTSSSSPLIVSKLSDIVLSCKLLAIACWIDQPRWRCHSECDVTVGVTSLWGGIAVSHCRGTVEYNSWSVYVAEARSSFGDCMNGGSICDPIHTALHLQFIHEYYSAILRCRFIWLFYVVLFVEAMKTNYKRTSDVYVIVR